MKFLDLHALVQPYTDTLCTAGAWIDGESISQIVIVEHPEHGFGVQINNLFLGCRDKDEARAFGALIVKRSEEIKTGRFAIQAGIQQTVGDNLVDRLK